MKKNVFKQKRAEAYRKMLQATEPIVQVIGQSKEIEPEEVLEPEDIADTEVEIIIAPKKRSKKGAK